MMGAAKTRTGSDLPRGMGACPHSSVLCCAVYVETLRLGDPLSET
jgi:hypothetical protein